MTNDPHTTSPGKERVWDYPRPPRLEPTSKLIRAEFRGVVLADTRKAFRVLETSHPPVYYIPPRDVATEYLREAPGSSSCEWKGRAGYRRRAMRRRFSRSTAARGTPAVAERPVT